MYIGRQACLYSEHKACRHVSADKDPRTAPEPHTAH